MVHFGKLSSLDVFPSSLCPNKKIMCEFQIRLKWNISCPPFDHIIVVFCLNMQLELAWFVHTLDLSLPNRLCFTTMSKKPNGKCLNEHQRCEIISKLSKTNAPSKRALTRKYNVSEGTIRKVWDNQEVILERSALLFEEAKERTFRASVGRFTELEDMLYIWIDSMRCAKLPVPPSLAIAKAKSIASSLSILESNFKTSWQWLSWFRARCGLQKMLLHEEGVEVNKNDP